MRRYRVGVKYFLFEFFSNFYCWSPFLLFYLYKYYAYCANFCEEFTVEIIRT